MRISEPQLHCQNGEVCYQVAVEYQGQSQPLWFSLKQQHKAMLSESSDAAMLALLLPAMLHGEDMLLDGKVSEQLLFNLQHSYQTLILNAIPRLHRIKIDAATQVANTKAKGVATGFSAGVDSFCSLVDYHSNSTPAALRITHLLFNNVGSLGKGGQALFQQRYDYLKSAADSLGLPFIQVNSNLEAFYGRALDFQLTHTLRNLCVPLLLQQEIGTFLYSSAYQFKDLIVSAHDDMAYYDPIALPLGSNEALTAVSVGSEYSRVEKTLNIIHHPLSKRYLNVCVKGDRLENCSSCSKCMRTMLTLEIAHCLSDFAAVFDLAAYYQQRNQFIAEALISSDPLLKEIILWARQQAFPLSKAIYVHATVLYLARLPRKYWIAVKRIIKTGLKKFGLATSPTRYY